MNPCPGVQRHRHGNARWLRQDHRLDLTEVAVDGSLHKSPCGGKGTGKNPTDRAKLGWKWSIATDRHGIPIGWTIEGANRNDSILLAPTLDDVADRGTPHRDRDALARPWPRLERHANAPRRARDRRRGHRQEVEAEPTCIHGHKESADGFAVAGGADQLVAVELRQMRRNTDRKPVHRLAQLALAVAFILTAKLINWRNRWSSDLSPLR